MQKNISNPEGWRGRLETLDLVRGLTLVSMFIYHGMWDFLYLTETGCRVLRFVHGMRGSADICGSRAYAGHSSFCQVSASLFHVISCDAAWRSVWQEHW